MRVIQLIGPDQPVITVTYVRLTATIRFCFRTGLIRYSSHQQAWRIMADLNDWGVTLSLARGNGFAIAASASS